MNGLTLAKKYYEQYGIPMLHEHFPELENQIAIGLCGSGSECFGFDDAFSTDHDFEPGFCMFVPDGLLDSRTEFNLERAYAKLPGEFMGYHRQKVNPVGGKRKGLLYIGDFLSEKTGTRNGTLTVDDHFRIPDHFLAEAVNGEIWRDDSGYFTQIRRNLSEIPEDVRLKKLAGHILLMGQSGQYNFTRCFAHDEPGAAMLAAGEFVRHTLAAVFLINRTYMPYYKWAFRGMRRLEILSDMAQPLEGLLCIGCADANVREKTDLIEYIAACVSEYLQESGLSDATCGDLEKNAYAVNDKISDIKIRTANILIAVE